MALLLIEGFDHFAETEADEKGWTVGQPSYAAIGSTYGRFGGQGVEMINCSFSSFGYISKSLGVNKSTIYFGIAVKKVEQGIPSINTVDWGLINFLDDVGVKQIKLFINGSYGLTAYRDTILLGSSADGVVPDNKWFYLEGKITISDTIGEVTLRINETQVLNLTSQDTKNGSDYMRYVYISAIYDDMIAYYDDLYIDDAQFHGDCRVRTFMPDLDGNSADFTRSAGSNDYECVDETLTNEDTDYISSNTLNHKSIFGITTGALGTVKAIQVNNSCRLDEAGVRKIKAIARSNATDYQGAESGEIAANYAMESEIWELDPDDSGAWTQTKLEAAEFGLEITT